MEERRVKRTGVCIDGQSYYNPVLVALYYKENVLVDLAKHKVYDRAGHFICRIEKKGTPPTRQNNFS